MVKATLQETERSLSQNDLQEETSRIMENAYDAVNTFLGTGAGAAGLGLVGGIILAVAPVVDVLGGFGLVTGAALAVLGASVLPRQRKKAIREFSERVDDLRDRLHSALREALEADVEHTLDRVWSTAEPYESFVEREREQLSSADEEVAAIQVELSEITGTHPRVDGRSPVISVIAYKTTKIKKVGLENKHDSAISHRSHIKRLLP